MSNDSRTSAARHSLAVALISNAVIGIVLGVIALLWPNQTLVTIATLFGIALVVAGLLRVLAAIFGRQESSRNRVLLGAFGVVVLVLGVVVIARPGPTLVFLAVIIGIGWIVTGLRDVLFGWGSDGRTRILGLVAGALQVAGGVIMLLLPQAGLSAFVVVAAILLIVVSAATLLTVPARRSARDS